MHTSEQGGEKRRCAKDAERRRLFAVYSKNLEFFQPLFAGHFACPICGQLFNEKALEPPLGVDLAHVYPESCGGKYATLTCSKCNNRLGTNFDHHVAMEKKLYDALSGKGAGTIDGRIYTDVGDMGVTISRRGDHFHFQVIPKQTKPGTGDAIASYMREKKKGEMIVSIPEFDPRRHAVSTLASGFLAAFAYWGYEYCFFGNTQWIRELLRRDEPAEDQRIITLPARKEDMKFQSKSLNDPLYTVGTALVKGTDSKVVAVALPAVDQDLAMSMVLLPGFGEEGKKQFEALWNHKPARIEVEYETWMGGIEERLVDPKRRDIGRRHFAYVFTTKYYEDSAKKEQEEVVDE